MKKVLVGGRFNILHPGHVYFLEKAKSLGDFLVVVIAHDATIRKQKKFLLFPARERKKLLESLSFVDKVVIGYPIGGEEGYLKMVRKEKPAIIALGYDQKINISRLHKQIASLGLNVKVVTITEKKGFKSRHIVKN